MAKRPKASKPSADRVFDLQREHLGCQLGIEVAQGGSRWILEAAGVDIAARVKRLRARIREIENDPQYRESEHYGA